MAAPPLEMLTGMEFNPSTFVADALEVGVHCFASLP